MFKTKLHYQPRTLLFVELALGALVISLGLTTNLGARNLFRPKGETNRQASPSASSIAPVVRVHRSGSFELTIPHNGTIGNGFTTATFEPGTHDQLPGFEFPKNSFLDYLFGGSLWVGAIVGRDTLVSVGADGWASSETMLPDPENPGVRIVSGVADENFEAIYHDSLPPIWNVPNTPGALGITVKQLSMAWNREPNNDFAVIEYQITNSFNPDTLQDVYVGLYMDGDIMLKSNSDGFTDDITGYLEGIAYLADNDGHPVNDLGLDWTEQSTRAVLGVKILDIRHSDTTTLKPPSFNWWISNGTAALDFGPRMSGTDEDPFRDFGGFLGTPEGAKNKYYILSHPEVDYDQLFASVDHTPLWLPPGDPNFADGFDTRFLISQGGVSLAPGDSLVFVVAIAIGDNYHVGPTDFADFFNPLQPETYYSKLDLTDLQRNIAAAESLYVSGYDVRIISPPPQPVLDDKLSSEPLMSWLFSGSPSVESYDVYLAMAPDSAVACQYILVDTPQFVPENIIANVATDTFRLTDLQDGKWYAAAVAVHPAPDSVTPISEPVVFQYGIPKAPRWDSAMFRNKDQLENGYISGSEEITLLWKTDDPDIDHFNVYRLSDTIASYSSLNVVGIGECNLLWRAELEVICSDFVVDSFMEVTQDSGAVWRFDSTIVCLTSKIEHAQVPGEELSFVESPGAPEKFIYGVTAVDFAGNESELSAPVIGYTVPEERKSVLVILSDSLRTNGITVPMTKSIFHFYRDLLVNYDVDFTFRRAPRGELSQWPPHYRLTANYETVIVDGSGGNMISGRTQLDRDRVYWVMEYARSGGSLVDLGIGFAPNRSFETPNNLVRTVFLEANSSKYDLGGEIFGLDSVLMVPAATGQVELDSVNGFYQPVGASAASDNGFPDLSYHHSGFYTSPIELTEGPIPNKGVMFPRGDNTEVLYTWVSGRDTASDFEGLPIGVKYTPETHTAYVLISNPWEWEPQQAQDFFAEILGDFQTDVTSDDEEQTLPKTFALAQNYPNPFNPTTKISYSVPSRAQVTLRVYNILGQKVETLVDEVKEAGAHVVTWDASEFASGMYFYKLSAGATKLSKKMVLLK